MSLIRKLSNDENTEVFGQEVRLVLLASQFVETSLRRTAVAYSVAQAIACDWVVLHPECGTYIEMQRQMYHSVRDKSGLPSQLCISALREVAQFVSTQPGHLLLKRPPFVHNRVRLEGGLPPRDFRFYGEADITLNTLDGRLRTKYASTTRTDLLMPPWTARYAVIESPFGADISMVVHVDRNGHRARETD